MLSKKPHRNSLFFTLEGKHPGFIRLVPLNISKDFHFAVEVIYISKILEI